MEGLILKDGYKSKIGLRETEKAIKMIKDTFQNNLVKALKLERISAPLFVLRNSGLNDDLNGVERAVSFDIKDIENSDCVVIHSLAKWKRMALKKYDFAVGEGLYTDMNAIRRDDDMDNTHSIYVDQWDWELVISRDQRNFEFLKKNVAQIVNAIADTQDEVNKKYSVIKNKIERNVKFITSQELEDLYPTLTPKQREDEITKKHKTVFIMQIGDILKSGNKHDGRAPDYDDWNLNGDLMLWNDVLQKSFEISSMGIRVDENSLVSQLEKASSLNRLEFPYHKSILNNEMPLTIGGGIGQSRLCMLLLEKLHIGEVHASIWSDEMIANCQKNNINLL